MHVKTTKREYSYSPVNNTTLQLHARETARGVSITTVRHIRDSSRKTSRMHALTLSSFPSTDDLSAYSSVNVS